MWDRKDSLHEQVSENQTERSLLIDETTLTSSSKRKRGRPRKVLTEQNTKSLKKAAFSPVGEKTNQKEEEMNPEREATVRHCTATAVKYRSLPFAKTSPIWLAVDLMEAFKKFPQKPHFAPLRELTEAHREGLAIALMVTFSTLVDKAFGFHCSDPKSSFHECLEALNDLDGHGFDIKPIELHIKKMLLMKEQVERFRENAQNVEKRIKELSQANERIDEEVLELDEKLKLLESKRGKNEMKVETLRKTVDGLKMAMELGFIDLSSGENAQDVEKRIKELSQENNERIDEEVLELDEKLKLLESKRGADIEKNRGWPEDDDGAWFYRSILWVSS